jgi:DNA-3-methyladenine glycosylase
MSLSKLTIAIRQTPPLARNFYNRDPREVSPDLLGKVLVRRGGRQLLAARIVEVEAYLGKDDPAAHSFRGPTPRNTVMFGPPGFAYVYFIYGNHYCLNVTCQPEGVAHALLFRAVEPLIGIEAMAKARGMTLDGPRSLRNLTSGPGRMAEAFGVTRVRDNGNDFTNPKSGLTIVDDGYRVEKIVITKRIGITKAADLPLRFLIAGNRFVSGAAKLNLLTASLA